MHSSRSGKVASQRAELAETHSAVVFFHGDRAYKVKKPVDLGFLDFRSVESRRAACEEEVRLNRRMTPDVYLGVSEVMDVAGEPCDYLVVMRRMPGDRRLSHLVDEGVNVDEPLRLVARQLAVLHGSSERSDAADEAAGVAATRSRWAANTDALLPYAGGRLLGDLTVGTVDGLAARYLEGRAALFEERVAAGRAVDGHGDLLADDIFCLDDGPRVLDCLDFDQRLRQGDGLADAAFLAMDLERLGRPDLGLRFLAAYREFTDDTWPASLAHHQIAYRAQVRAKVGAIASSQGDEHAGQVARQVLGIALHHLEVGRVRLVVVGGLPGTGKSTLAIGIADHFDATVFRSDEIRKELAGLTPSTPAPASYGAGLYSAGATAATYDAMLSRAATALAHGESVVLDASWTDPEWRARARAVGGDTVADMVELECRAPAALAVERIRRRQIAGGDPSDATPEIAAAMAAETAPWPTAVSIDTSQAIENTLAHALSHLIETRR
jgi:aminoglycoside phosphotransferase family enzyme/predicted kinase